MLQHHPVMNSFIENDVINYRFVTNPEISFEDYLEVIFNATECYILSVKGDVANCPEVTDSFVSMLQKLSATAQLTTFKSCKK